MRWVRSWPASPPAGRPHVVDDLERLVIDDYDYTPLGGLGEDVIVIEWDVAIDPDDADEFAARCSRRRSQVRVAPYRLHDETGTRWAHRRIKGGVESWADPSWWYCDLFGFGLVYLPAQLVAAFLAAPAPERGRPPWAEHYEDCRLTDQTFSTWHYYRSGEDIVVPIDWDLPAVHLH